MVGDIITIIQGYINNARFEDETEVSDNNYGYANTYLRFYLDKDGMHQWLANFAPQNVAEELLVASVMSGIAELEKIEAEIAEELDFSWDDDSLMRMRDAENDGMAEAFEREEKKENFFLRIWNAFKEAHSSHEKSFMSYASPGVPHASSGWLSEGLEKSPPSYRPNLLGTLLLLDLLDDGHIDFFDDHHS